MSNELLGGLRALKQARGGAEERPADAPVSNPLTGSGAPAQAMTEPVALTGPYLTRSFPRGEPAVGLGARVRVAAKYVLEDYTQSLKRAGWPATETRVMEAMFHLLEEDVEVRARVTRYLTGGGES